MRPLISSQSQITCRRPGEGGAPAPRPLAFSMKGSGRTITTRAENSRSAIMELAAIGQPVQVNYDADLVIGGIPQGFEPPPTENTTVEKKMGWAPDKPRK